MAEHKEGWNWLWNATKWHYFGHDGRSLCGRYLSFSAQDAELGNDNSSSNCKACRDKRLKQLAEAEHKPLATKEGRE